MTFWPGMQVMIDSESAGERERERDEVVRRVHEFTPEDSISDEME